MRTKNKINIKLFKQIFLDKFYIKDLQKLGEMKKLGKAKKHEFTHFLSDFDIYLGRKDFNKATYIYAHNKICEILGLKEIDLNI